jgi:hypothetical protein
MTNNEVNKKKATVAWLEQLLAEWSDEVDKRLVPSDDWLPNQPELTIFQFARSFIRYTQSELAKFEPDQDGLIDNLLKKDF